MSMMNRRSFVKCAGVTGAAAAGVAACGTALAAEAPAADTAGTAEGAEAAPSNAVAGTPVAEYYQCQEDWLGEAPVIDPAEIVETVDTEVVIVGAGHAGSQAFLSASQAGAKCILIESQDEDMYSCYGEDFATYNSKLLTERGLGGYDLGEITAEYIRRGAGRVNPKLIAQFVSKSGEMLDNLVATFPEGSTILDFDNTKAHVQVAYGMPDSSYYPIVRGGFKGWASTIQTLACNESIPVNGREGVTSITAMEIYAQNAAVALGSEVRFGTSAVVLVQNDEGDVTGVIAKGPEGYVQFNASKAVCVCTGDFGGNADMCINLLDDCNEMTMRAGGGRDDLAGMSRSGYGHKMLCWAGGVIESHPRPSNNSNGGMPGPWGNSPFLMLNADGDRFMNEAMSNYAVAECARQPHGTICNVTDAKWFETVKLAGVDHGAPNFGDAAFKLGYVDKLQEQMEAVRGTGAEGYPVEPIAIIHESPMPAGMSMTSTVYCGETLEELLGYMGYTGDALQNALKSIEHYNELCAQGCDLDYGKESEIMLAVDEPPFYGTCQQNTGVISCGLVTLAGMVTDDNFNVLRPDYTTPIKGLYVAGNTLGHRYGPAYSAPSAGNTIGMAMTHGYCLGQVVAAL